MPIRTFLFLWFYGLGAHFSAVLALVALAGCWWKAGAGIARGTAIASIAIALTVIPVHVYHWRHWASFPPDHIVDIVTAGGLVADHILGLKIASAATVVAGLALSVARRTKRKRVPG